MKSSRRKPAKQTKRAASRKAGKRPAVHAENPAPAPAAALAIPAAEADAILAAAPASSLPEERNTAAPPVAAPQRAGLKLESSFTLRDANDMLFQLLAVDFGDADVLVDGGGVERID